MTDKQESHLRLGLKNGLRTAFKCATGVAGGLAGYVIAKDNPSIQELANPELASGSIAAVSTVVIAKTALPTVKAIKYAVSKAAEGIRDIRKNNYNYTRNYKQTMKNAYKYGAINGAALAAETAIILPNFLEALNNKPEVRPLYEISNNDLAIWGFGAAGIVCLCTNTYYATKNSFMRSFTRNAVGNVAGFTVGTMLAATAFVATEVTPKIIDDHIERETSFGKFAEEMTRGTSNHEPYDGQNYTFD